MIDLVEYAKNHTEDEVAIFRRSTEKHRAAIAAIRERAEKQASLMLEALEKTVAAIGPAPIRAMLLDALFNAAHTATEKSATQMFATFAFDPGNDGRILAAVEEYFILQKQLSVVQLMASEYKQKDRPAK